MIAIPIILSVLIAAAMFAGTVEIVQKIWDRHYGVLASFLIAYFTSKGAAILIFFVWVGWAVLK